MNNFIENQLKPLFNTELKPLPTDFESAKTHLDTTGQLNRNRGIAAIATAVAVLAIGLILCLAGGPIGMGLGITLIACSLPMFYFAHNCLKMGENLKDLAANLKREDLNNIDMLAFKQKIGKDTFVYDWEVERTAKALLEPVKA